MLSTFSIDYLPSELLAPIFSLIFLLLTLPEPCLLLFFSAVFLFFCVCFVLFLMSLSPFNKDSLLRLYPSISDSTLSFDCKSSNLSIAHQNIRSILNKIDIISSSQLLNFDIIMFTESWLTPEIPNHLLNLDNYQIFRKDRASGTGGGIIIFVKTNITVLPLFDINIDESESLFLKIPLSPSGPPLIIGCVYRPPSSSVINFCNSLSSTFDSFPSSSPVTLLGDFNINLHSDTHTSNYFKSTLSSLQISCRNSLPTRVTDSSESLLDLILSSHPSIHSKSVTYFDDLSDHFVIGTFLSLNPKRQPKSLITKRSFKNFSSETFFNYCKYLPFHYISNIPSLDDKVNYLTLLISSALNIFAPFKTFRVRGPKKPWLTKTLLQIISYKNSLFKYARSCHSSPLWYYYKQI